MQKKNQLFFDTECYPNYFLIVFKDLNGNEECFVKDENNVLPVARIRKLLETRQTIGFNSRMYDIPMITYALSGVSNSLLKEMSNSLIPDKKLLKAKLVPSTFDVIKKNNLWCPFEYDHIDLFKVTGAKSGLKVYGARIGSKKIQDLPYDHLEPLTQEQKKDVKAYCVNDVDLTSDLFKYLHKELKVRYDINEHYGIDSRSKSDSQIAETVIKKLCKFDISKLKNNSQFKFGIKLDFKFENESLINLRKDLDDIEFNVQRHRSIEYEGVHREININGTKYQFGIGGLHSKERRRSIIANEDEWFIDVDVSSCYPKIILNHKLSPPQIEGDFLRVFGGMFDGRQFAKKILDLSKSDVFKLMLNAIFGKYGDDFSDVLFAPEMLINTTLTGQLGLLLLIEKLEKFGFSVVSANTDGITVLVKKIAYDRFRTIISAWEKKFNYSTDEVKYTALYNHSVNSYIAVKEDGSLKLKGIFSESAINRNVNVPICKKAVINYVTKGIRIEDTILNEKHDPRHLIKMRKVEDGGYWKGEFLGKVVRWYWSTKGEHIINPKGHKVANTDFAFPIMNLDYEVKDLHYEKYIKESYKLLSWIGIKI